MKVIDLLNRIANGKIEDKRTFNIRFKNGLYRSIYYDKGEENCMCCLKNVSDDYSIYDDISFDDEIETIEEDKGIENNFQHVYDSDNDMINANFENIRATLENIIKEVREYVEKYRENKEKLQNVMLCSSKLLEILDKEVN